MNTAKKWIIVFIGFYAAVGLVFSEHSSFPNGPQSAELEKTLLCVVSLDDEYISAEQLEHEMQKSFPQFQSLRKFFRPSLSFCQAAMWEFGLQSDIPLEYQDFLTQGIRSVDGWSRLSELEANPVDNVHRSGEKGSPGESKSAGLVDESGR